MIGNETAVRSDKSFPKPSPPTAKLLPSEGIHSALVFHWSFEVKKINPAIETIHVTMDESNAHTLGEFPSFRKNEMNPLNNGIIIRRTGIIGFVSVYSFILDTRSWILDSGYWILASSI